jgi:general secretion pathway protein L
MPEDQVHWLVWSEQEQEIIASGILDTADELSTLKERTGQNSCILIVPGSEVTLKTIELPGKANRKLLSAVPFMLEDELSQDVEELFFAWHKQIDKSQQMVIVNHSVMQHWIEVVQDADLDCDKIIPDFLCIPHKEDSWQAIQLEAELIVRQGPWQGFTGEQSWMESVIELHAKKQEQKVSIEFSTEPYIHNLANTEISYQPGPLPMQTLAQEAVKNSFNLRQEQYKAKKRGKSQISQWRLAAILAGVALLTTFVDKGIQASQLKQQEAEMQEQIVQEFRRAFPDTRRIVNVRTQMRQKIEALEQSGSGISMLAMMSQLNEAFSASQIKPQTLRFDRSRTELRMQAVADGYESLETFKRLAEQKGFSVEQGAINNKDNQVVGSLLVKS